MLERTCPSSKEVCSMSTMAGCMERPMPPQMLTTEKCARGRRSRVVPVTRWLYPNHRYQHITSVLSGSTAE